MASHIYTYVFVYVILYCLMEYLYISLMMPIYKNHFAVIQNKTPSELMPFRVFPWMLVLYPIMLIVVWIFVIHDVVTQKSTLLTAIQKSVILALGIYGVYNITNYITLENYRLHIAVIDTLWGTMFFTMIVLCMYTLRRILRNR